jgi:hypothetical protein
MKGETAMDLEQVIARLQYLRAQHGNRLCGCAGLDPGVYGVGYINVEPAYEPDDPRQIEFVVVIHFA